MTYTKTLLAVSIFTAFSAAGTAQAITPDWEGAPDNAAYKVNVDGTQTAGSAAYQPSTDYENHAVIYASGKNITGGATASSGLLAMGSVVITNGTEGVIYADGQGGYTSGMATGYNSSAKVINEGTIFVRGNGGTLKTKGISVDDGSAVNNGLIEVWDGVGMVSNSQGNSEVNVIENNKTIIVHNGYGMVDNKGKGVEIKNSGIVTAEGENSAAILVGSDSSTGSTVIDNSGTVTGTNGAAAIKVASTRTEVVINLSGTSDVEGTVDVASSSGTNNTSINVSDVASEDLQLNADYLKGLSVANSDLTIGTTDTSVATTIDTMSTDGKTLTIKGDRALTVNTLAEGESASFVFDTIATAGSSLKVVTNNVANTSVDFTASAVDGYASPEEMTEALKAAVSLSADGSAAGTVTGNGTSYTVSVDAVTGQSSTVASDITQSSLDMAAMTLVAWRNETTTLTDRMSTLRSNPDQYGAWARWNGGEYKFDDRNLSNKFNTIEVGADTRIGNGPWTVGASLAYTKGEGDFVNGESDTDAYTGALYALWSHESGSFVDMMMKTGRINSDYDFFNEVGGGRDAASFKQTGFIMGVETGHRFALSDMVFVEPQLQLTYSRLAGIHETTAARTIDMEASDSLVGRIGVMAGVKCPNIVGDAYVRVSALRDFRGDVDGTFSGYKASQELDQNWVEFAVGANFKLADNFYTFVDVQKSTGGDIELDWRANVGAKLFF